jgi:hypothetical protein
MRKSHECHSEPKAKNLAFSAANENEILRLRPQDDTMTQSYRRDGEPFEEKLHRLMAILRQQQAEGAKLDTAITVNRKGLGHGG